jgi:drug/metabolite transporter (DMT)-like permease
MKKNPPFIRIEYLLILISTFFWALGHPVGKIIVQTVHPFQLAALKMIIGFFSLFIYLAFEGKLRELFHISVKDLVVSLILGVFGFFFYQIATFSALARIPASMNASAVLNRLKSPTSQMIESAVRYSTPLKHRSFSSNTFIPK